ncbi:MAG: alpha/beta hydrolase [Janthinobacterium lividum]
MPIISKNDQVILGRYNAISEINIPKMRATQKDPVEGLKVYRAFMAELTQFLHPPGFKGVEIGSFQAERPLRPGLTAAVAVPKGPGPFPIWVHAHGHGLRAGHPWEYEGWMREIASHGFVVIFPDYRLQPEATFENEVDDMLFAINWAKQRAPELKGDVERLILGGDSSGGFLAFTILMRQLDDPAGLRFRAFAGVDTQFNQADALIAAIKPETPLPPIYLIAGSADRNAGLPVLHFAVKMMELKKDFCLDGPYGMPHDFLKMPNLDAAKEYNLRMAQFLKNATS